MDRRKRTRHRKERQKQSVVSDPIILDVERIVPGGFGLSHTSDGKTVFVELAAPGDRVRVQINRVQGRVSFASVIEVIKPSSSRIKPPCPYFGRCGGCDFQQLNYDAQLMAKVDIIRDCLRRIGRIQPPADIPITSSPETWHYRSRARWQYDPGNSDLGYFELNSHRVCDVAECPVIIPTLQNALSIYREQLRADSGLPGLKDIKEIEVVAGDDSVSVFSELYQNNLNDTIRTVNGEKYRFNARCFFQINHQLLEALMNEALGNAYGEKAVDLYCGVGLFTLPLARRFKKVLAVEGNSLAVSYAQSNLAEANLSNTIIDSAKVSDWITHHAQSTSQVDFLLLDPPRSGAEPETISGMLKIRPTRISYVSCDPATLARDLQSLISGGYRMDRIAAFDMFPQTHHVETVVQLVREL